MKPEDVLEQWLEHSWYPSAHPHGSPVRKENDDVTSCLTAAERVSHLQQIEVPAQFASRLEQSLRAQIRAHRSQSLTQEHRPAGTDIQGLRMVSSGPLALRQQNQRKAPRRRPVVALLGVAALLVLAFVFLLSLATGLPLGTRTASSSPTGRPGSPTPTISAQAQLQNDLASLQNDLTNLKTAVVNQQGDATIQAALQDVVTRTQVCQQDVTTMPAGTLRTAAQQKVTQTLMQEEQTLRTLLGPLSWPLRVAFTQQLDVLGDPVPTIAHVSARPQINGTVLIVITGAHIDAQAMLVFDGQRPKAFGIVKQSGPQQFTVGIPVSQWPPNTHEIGVLNSDGTAAQGRVSSTDDQSGSSTPTPDH